MTRNNLDSTYQDNINKYEKEVDLLSLKNKKLIFLRLLFFTILIYFLVLSIKSGKAFPFLIISLISLMFFLFMVRLSLKNSTKLRFYKNLVSINKKELEAIDHKFESFNSGKEYTDPSHPFSFDLDIFGEGSIFQQMDRSSSSFGSRKLASWLGKPLMKKNEILNRQKAVKEITQELILRQKFIALGMDISNKKDKREQIIDWAENSISKKDYSFLNITSKIFSFSSIVLISLIIFGILSPSLLFPILIFNGSIIFTKIKKVNKEHSQISRQFELISQYAGQIKHLENHDFKSSDLIKLKEKILGDDHSGSKTLKQLASIISSFDYRLNFIVSIVLNGFFYWDFICMLRLYKWKKTHSNQLKQWFNALDEFDAFQSIANFSFNNPDFVFAQITDSEGILDAEKLGHPQIKRENRISNNITIKNKGEFFIITGPNMAGKSTFLRTTGEALVLSQAGAPVCAERFTISPVKLYSSMRTSDSLHKNESYFYAELKRLKEIIAAIDNNDNIFIILDEILKGTNSIDKAKGSKAFLKKITKIGATGIVATHDLSLGELENEMPDIIKNYCFEAETDDDIVTFDYKLKRGITSRMNATVLMKQMGII